MSLLNLCGRRLSTVPILANVAEAVQLMIDNEVGAVAVVDDEGIVAGMFTERDVLEKFALSGRDPRQTPVRELMSPMVEMATEETTPAEALEVMLERHYRHMPIVDDKGKVLGILSIRHILEARIDRLLQQLATASTIR
jgi:CBS domain-containing protein